MAPVPAKRPTETGAMQQNGTHAPPRPAPLIAVSPLAPLFDAVEQELEAVIDAGQGVDARILELERLRE